MVSTDANIYAFTHNAIEYLRRYNFDGIDIDWEYPAARGGVPADKTRFTKLFQVSVNPWNYIKNINKEKKMLDCHFIL